MEKIQNKIVTITFSHQKETEIQRAGWPEADTGDRRKVAMKQGETLLRSGRGLPSALVPGFSGQLQSSREKREGRGSPGEPCEGGRRIDG